MHKILSVDDEPINQAIVEELFNEQFDVALVSSGEECLQEIDRIKPELILMDVSMPGIDGYQTCRELKIHQSNRQIPVIFVSARSTLEDKIKGYEAGGHDYITKPFNHAELEIKIKHTIKTVKQSITAEVHQDNKVHEAATTSVNSAIVIQFLGDSFYCNSPDELGKLLLNTCRNLQLNYTFQFRIGSERLNYSSNMTSSSEISPLELSLIEHISDQDRFFDFNSRTIVTFPQVSLLVKNMPRQDENRYTELRDLLGTLAAGAELKLKLLLTEATLSSHYESTFKNMKEHLIEFDKYSESLREKNITNIKDFATRIENFLLDSELNTSQKTALQSIIKELQDRTNEVFFARLPLEEKIRTVRDALYKLSRQT